MNKNTVVLKVKGLSKSYNLQNIFKNVDFDIKYGDRIGLVGYNGTGKTTLAKILSGKEEPDQGHIESSINLKIGYLSQSSDYELNDFHHTATDHSDFYQLTSELGLTRVKVWENQRLQHVSGGEKLKLALSMIWTTKPNVLILDEPTNHLDFTGIQWLVEEIKKFNGPVFIISHDRHFLDQTVNRIYELEHGKIHFFNGNYSDYIEKKKKLREEQQYQYEVQQRKKQDIERQMGQLKSWSKKAHRTSTKEEGFKEYHRVKAKRLDKQVKSKMKRLESELEKNKIDRPHEEAQVRFQFESQGKRGKRIIEAKKLTKSIGNRILFQPTHFYINHGERIGIIGENGCGKTTLLKLILGEESIDQGDLWKSDSLKIAYLSQDVADMPVNKLIMDALGYTDKEDIYKARTYLANLGLREEHLSKPIGMLSLGERTRVKVVDILMKDYDVLILDEPTNHLDLPTREQLEQTLNEFSGTIIMVSHDYYFLNKLCNQILVFENQQIHRKEMTPDEYFNPKKQIHGNKEEELMVIENKIVSILGELSLIDQSNPKYAKLDQEFKQLLLKKKSLL
ncbi:ribosomal protection-like ABC-F family protein [Neobacillus sp. LXY-1]|uniref:ribosomal protection-like ABC-F family protein n=1 Tax=Neobacillus sp. LXY-1 TaxID=3379133 RepID=UPI003EE38A77